MNRTIQIATLFLIVVQSTLVITHNFWPIDKVEFLIVGSSLLVLLFIILKLKKYKNNVKKESDKIATLLITSASKSNEGQDADLFQKIEAYQEWLVGHVTHLVNNERIDTVEASDKVTQSIKELDQKLFDYRKADELRDWHNSGIGKFNNIFTQYNKVLDKLCDETLVNLIRYADLNQGAIFLREKNEDQPYGVEFRAISTYAYGRKKHGENIIEGSTGLVGQSYLENSSLFIKEIPNDYVRITSGLGEATPSSIFIVPLRYEEDTVAMLEVASLKTITEHQQRFIESIAEPLAATMKSILRADEMEALLNSSLEKTEMLKATEEELKQNMEELQSTHESMVRQQAELEQLKDESVQRFQLINKSAESVLFDIKANDGSIRKERIWWSDSAYRLIFNSQPPSTFDDFRQLIHPKDLDRFFANLNALLRSYTNKETLNIDFRLCIDDSYLWVKLTASPLFKDKELIRLAGSINDISKEKKAENDIQTLKQKSTMLLGSMNTGIITFKDDFIINYVNPEAEEILGSLSYDLVGQSIESILELDENFKQEEERFIYCWITSKDYFLDIVVDTPQAEGKKLEVSVEEINNGEEKEYILILKSRKDLSAPFKTEDLISGHIIYIEEKFGQLKACIDSDFIDLSENISDQIKRLNELAENTSDDHVVNQTKVMMAELNRIMVDLQFHDTLLQKMQHTYAAHQLINQSEHPEAILNHTLKLFIYQMAYVRSEYETLSKEIVSALFEVMQNQQIVEDAGLKYLDSFKNQKATMAVIDQIVRLYRKLNKYVKDNDLCPVEAEKIQNQIYNSYSIESEREVFAKVYGLEHIEDDTDIELF